MSSQVAVFLALTAVHVKNGLMSSKYCGGSAVDQHLYVLPNQTQNKAQASSSSKLKTLSNEESVKIIQSILSRRRNVKRG